MKYLVRLSWGIVIYAIVYLSWNGFAIYGFAQGLAPRLCELIVLVAIATIAGRGLKFDSWKDILPYSFSWMLIVLALDAAYTLPFTGVQMYSNPSLWIGYALIVLIPLVAPQTRFLDADPTVAP